MLSNASHQSNVNDNVNDPPRYDKDRTVEGAPMKASELASKCTTETCGHDAVDGGTQVIIPVIENRFNVYILLLQQEKKD